jgi:hypothetical protein
VLLLLLVAPHRVSSEALNRELMVARHNKALPQDSSVVRREATEERHSKAVLVAHLRAVHPQADTPHKVVTVGEDHLQRDIRRRVDRAAMAHRHPRDIRRTGGVGEELSVADMISYARTL